MRRSDRELVDEALTHLGALRRHLRRTDLSDETVADAVSLRLAAMIDALAKTSEQARRRLVGDDWALIWGTRNRIVHGYATIDRDLIRATVEADLPGLEDRLVRFR